MGRYRFLIGIYQTYSTMNIRDITFILHGCYKKMVFTPFIYSDAWESLTPTSR